MINYNHETHALSYLNVYSQGCITSTCTNYRTVANTNPIDPNLTISGPHPYTTCYPLPSLVLVLFTKQHNSRSR